MKKIIIIIVLLFSIKNYSQESFLKEYKIILNNNTHVLYKNSLKEYKNFTQKEIEELKEKFKINTVINYTINEKINNKDVVVKKKVLVDNNFYKSQKLEVIEEVKLSEILKNNKPRKGYVKMVDDKLYVNIVNSDKLYYYKLKSGEEFKLKFTEITVSALTIPLKYRFELSDSISDNYTTSINLNGFFGISGGTSNFMYRKGVDSKINTEKCSLGVLGGFSTVKLTSKNSKLTEDKTNNNGLLSLGIGATYSFNKINIGGFYGWDFAIGEDSKQWNYQGKPWVGIALGYSLFKL